MGKKGPYLFNVSASTPSIDSPSPIGGCTGGRRFYSLSHYWKSTFNARHTRGREPRSRMSQGAPQTQGVHIASRRPCQVLADTCLGCQSNVIQAVLAGQRMTDDPYYAWPRASDRLSSCRRGCASLIEYKSATQQNGQDNNHRLLSLYHHSLVLSVVAGC